VRIPPGRLPVALVATAAVLALVPAGAVGARSRTFGSTLDRPPSHYRPPATCDTTGANLDTGPCTRVALAFAGTGAVKGRVRAPMKGFIRRIRMRAAAPGTVRLRLVRLRAVDYDQVQGEGRAVSRSVPLRLKGRGLRRKRPIETFRMKLRVRRGDYLALESSSITAMTCRPVPDFEQLIFEPPLQRLGPFQLSSGSDDCTLLVQATIKRR
jgi:hypothetical protein